MGFIIYNGLFMSVIITVLVADSCTNWRLSGGTKWYEGAVEVIYNQTWVNICDDDSFREENRAKEVCWKIYREKGGGAKVDAVYHEYNGYGAKEKSRAISLSMCRENSEISERPCKAAFICCYDRGEDPCSKNWTSTVKLESFLRATYHLRFDQLRDETNFTNENIGKSWTRSALQEQSCEGKSSTEDNIIGFNCTSRCEVTSDLVFIVFNSDNKTCCLENQTRQTLPSGDCSIRDLSVVNETNTTRFCLAAEVINGVRYISIENCGRHFQAFRVSREKWISRTSPTARKTTTTTTTTITTTANTSNSNSYSNKSGSVTAKETTVQTNDSDERIDTVIIAVIICVSLLATVCIVFSIVISWKFKQSGRNRESQRPNSVINRAYSIEPFHHLPQDDEEYTLISDMEVGHGSLEPYIPPVPERDDKLNSFNTKNQDKNTKEIEIITLAEYSIPSDNVKDGYKISQSSDYCMTTYDDPMRYKIKEGKETENESDSTENCSQSMNENSGTNSKDLDRNSRNSQISGLNRNSAVFDGKTNFTGMKYADDTSDTIESGNTQNTYEDSVKTIDRKHDTIVHGDTVTILGDTDAEVEKDDGDDSDYEDSSFFDGNLPAKCPSKMIFEEHVCLGCLKPEHLTKLGIKIISDEMYEKSKNLQRSASDPPSHVYYNKIESDSCEENKSTSERKPQEDQIHERYQVKNGEDTLTELNVVRRQKKVSNKRRCSVCHTVYDRLGDTKQNVWANCTDNVYDQFGNFEHFKHRRQISGKRMNST